MVLFAVDWAADTASESALPDHPMAYMA
jgi:hypothetical protein